MANIVIDKSKLLEKPQKFEKLDKIISRYEGKKSNLVAILQRIQEEYQYLPEEALTYLSQKMELPLANIYGVATFYSLFSLNPKGKYQIKVCDGTACHVRKSIPVLNAIKEKLNLNNGKTVTDDLKFSLETVNCLGACGLAPVVVINDEIYPEMTPEKVKEIIDRLQVE